MVVEQQEEQVKDDSKKLILVPGLELEEKDLVDVAVVEVGVEMEPDSHSKQQLVVELELELVKLMEQIVELAVEVVPMKERLKRVMDFDLQSISLEIEIEQQRPPNQEPQPPCLDHQRNHCLLFLVVHYHLQLHSHSHLQFHFHLLRLLHSQPLVHPMRVELPFVFDLQR